MRDEQAGREWLVLAYQFPKGPGSARVRIWRRLQGIGAVAIRNSVYLLPLNEQSQEDFAWLLAELKSGGGDGVILESRFVDGLSDQQARMLFDGARSADYRALGDELEQALAALPAAPDTDDPESAENARRCLQRARKQIADIEAIDFFGAQGHDAVESAMRDLERRLQRNAETETSTEPAMTHLPLAGLKNRIWVTRRGVRVDRIASAWLIRRWIDPEARFKFVSGEGYAPVNREIRFDMFDAEFTHDGDRCTFEVLARLFRQDDEALRKIGEVVHDIDLKDEKFGRPEAPGIASLLAGLVIGIDDDDLRIERGSAVFEDLYRFFNEGQP